MCYCASVDHHTPYIPTQVTSSIVFYVRDSARGRVVKKLVVEKRSRAFVLRQFGFDSWPFPSDGVVFVGRSSGGRS